MAWLPHMEKYGLTKQQAKLFDVLADGEVHSKADIIVRAFDGRFACDHLVPVHVNRIRGKLKGQGVAIVSLGTSRNFLGYQIEFTEGAA